jgi:hypothetical protein
MALAKDEEFLTTLPGNGYTLLLLDSDHDNQIVDKVPVLGFMVFKYPEKDGFYTSVYPVLADCVMDGDLQNYVLMRPTGEIEIFEGPTYPSLEEWQAAVRESAKPDAPAPAP